MNEVTVIGIDLAKSVFEVCLKAADGRVVERRRLRRAAFERFMETAPRVLVGLEAGPGAHYWARWLKARDFAVKVMSPRAVRAYRDGPHKSDALDADAVGEAATRARVRAVAIKSEEAQCLQALIRVRACRIAQRTRVTNQLGSLMVEFGIAAGRNLATWYNRIAATPAFAAAPEEMRLLFDELIEDARALDRRIRQLDAEIARQVKDNPLGWLLTTVPGIGPVTTAQIIARIASPDDFANARAMPAFLGLVPRLIASGETSRLGPITKHGPADIRQGLVLGAQAVITAALRNPAKDDPLYVLARKLLAKGKERNKVAVALANRMARIACVILQTEQPYNPPRRAA
jgi:transposase